jgi:hypothetical protein
MNKAFLTQRLGVDLLDRADQARGTVADDRQRGRQAAVVRVSEEVLPRIEGLAGARPMNAGLPPVVMPQAASTGSAGEPGCIRKKLASRNR